MNTMVNAQLSTRLTAFIGSLPETRANEKKLLEAIASNHLEKAHHYLAKRIAGSSNEVQGVMPSSFGPQSLKLSITDFAGLVGADDAMIRLLFNHLGGGVVDRRRALINVINLALRNASPSSPEIPLSKLELEPLTTAQEVAILKSVMPLLFSLNEGKDEKYRHVLPVIEMVLDNPVYDGVMPEVLKATPDRIHFIEPFLTVISLVKRQRLEEAKSIITDMSLELYSKRDQVLSYCLSYGFPDHVNDRDEYKRANIFSVWAIAKGRMPDPLKKVISEWEDPTKRTIGFEGHLISLSKAYCKKVLNDPAWLDPTMRPLNMALDNGQEEIASKLIHWGAEVLFKTPSQTLNESVPYLAELLARGQGNVFRWVVNQADKAHRSDLKNKSTTFSFNTKRFGEVNFLAIAALSGDRESTAFLLDKGATVNSLSKEVLEIIRLTQPATFALLPAASSLSFAHLKRIIFRSAKPLALDKMREGGVVGSKEVLQNPLVPDRLMGALQDPLQLNALTRSLDKLGLTASVLGECKKTVELAKKLSPVGGLPATGHDASDLHRLWTLNIPEFLAKLIQIPQEHRFEVREGQTPALEVLKSTFKVAHDAMIIMQSNALNVASRHLDAEAAVIAANMHRTFEQFDQLIERAEEKIEPPLIRIDLHESVKRIL